MKKIKNTYGTIKLYISLIVIFIILLIVIYLIKMPNSLNPVKIWHSISSNPSDWALFGSFISPIFSLLSILLVLFTIQKNREINMYNRRIEKIDELVKYINELFEISNKYISGWKGTNPITPTNVMLDYAHRAFFLYEKILITIDLYFETLEGLFLCSVIKYWIRIFSEDLTPEAESKFSDPYEIVSTLKNETFTVIHEFIESESLKKTNFSAEKKKCMDDEVEKSLEDRFTIAKKDQS